MDMSKSMLTRKLGTNTTSCDIEMIKSQSRIPFLRIVIILINSSSLTVPDLLLFGQMQKYNYQLEKKRICINVQAVNHNSKGEFCVIARKTKWRKHMRVRDVAGQAAVRDNILAKGARENYESISSQQHH